MSTIKEQLLSDENIRRWYDNLYSVSPHTAIPRLYRLSNFCVRSSVTPQALVELEQKKLEDIVQDSVRGMEKEDLSPGYIHGVMTAINSWLDHNERELKRDIKIKDYGADSKIQQTEEVPEPAVLDNVFPVATVRARVSISFMAYSGVRPEVLGNVDGTDGLVLKDLPDLSISALQFRTIPAQIIVRREISKAKHQYFTFLNEKGCNLLLDYLRQRVKASETLELDSPVVAAEHKRKDRALKALNYDGEIRYFVCT